MDADKRGPGRPPGSRNKIRGAAKTDYSHADPDTIVSRQLSMLETAQRAMRDDMERMTAGNEKWVQPQHIISLEKLSNAIVRAIDALKKSADLADELASRLTPEQLLEAALKKLEAQDLPTLNYAIKRLKAKREQLQPNAPAIKDAPIGTAVAAMAELS